MLHLREYQARAVNGIQREWASGKRSVLCVLPTGGGKTVIAVALIRMALEGGQRILFIVHTRELLTQTIDRLREHFGLAAVDTIRNPRATIRVGTVQALVRCAKLPDAGLVVFDEAHHYIADTWGNVAQHYAQAKLMGLTATPERGDGKPLGDLFDSIVVGATYSELLRDGYLVDCEVLQPPAEAVSGSSLACNPVDAYLKHAKDSRAFLFTSSVDQATGFKNEFKRRGVEAGLIVANTRPGARARLIADFKRGDIKVMCNVTCLTEGIDIPAAETIILARGCQHVSQYLQIVGRGLRPHPGKSGALLLDLTGATHRHGMPTADREYALTGDGIQLAETCSIRTCPQCGHTAEPTPICPTCGYEFPKAERKPPRVYSFELIRANTEELQATPGGANALEYNRLRAVQRDKGHDCHWVIAEYKKRFGLVIHVHDATAGEKQVQLAKFTAIGRARGWKPGFAKVRFKSVFGHWPLRARQ